MTAGTISAAKVGWVGRPLRLREWVQHRWSRLAVPPRKEKSKLTFLIPHHNAAEFLEVCLHAVRTHHPDSHILVADSASAPEQYLAAKVVCRRFEAELLPFFLHHGHTAQLNFLLCRADAEAAVFLDQDCILMHPLHALFEELKRGKVLVGPCDEMRLTHPNFGRKYPGALNERLRLAPDFIHASLMVTRPRRLRELFGRRPFYWDPHWNREGPARPFQVERYYGLCERLRRYQPGSMLALESVHSGYGLGMVYWHNSIPLAYHNWYSGRIFKLHGKVDASLDVDWLRAEMERFLSDYWNGRLDFQLPKEIPAMKQD